MSGIPRRFTILILAAVLIGCGASQETGRFQSTFGYSAEVPDQWELIDRTAFQDYRDVTESLNLGITNPALEEVVRESLRHDDFDFFLIVDDSSDVVGTVTSAIDGNPDVTTGAELNDLCTWLPQGFADSTSQPVDVAACEYRRRAGVKSVYVSIDGPVQSLGTRIYMIPQSEELVLLIGLTASRDEISQSESDYERFISSIKILEPA